ncbi:hypothetical protein R5R35_005311 [Gryllus longicercus]|uniref:15-cis-phytoene synthase n=2 Tax=Gryllus longicercus TaxID=2509291 RepID=A0AAN9Z1C0_9ORTH
MSSMKLIQFPSISMLRFVRSRGHVCYSTSANSSPAEYCIDLVRKYDYENFLSTLLLPKQIRTCAFAVRAFNIEVARVQDSVSETRIGQMRIKFWEETIEKLYRDEVPKHPVAVQLHRAVKNHKLSKRYLKRLITIRENYLVSRTFLNFAAMEHYAEHSVSSIFYLLLESAGIENLHADHVASHLGKAQGITNLIRGTVHNAQHKILTLPQDILLQNDVSHEQIFRGQSSDGLNETVFYVAKAAIQHLRKAKSMNKQIPKNAAVVFLPAVTVESYLSRLQSSCFNVFDGPPQRRNPFLPLALYWNKIFAKY